MIELLPEIGTLTLLILFTVAIIAGIVDTISGGGGLITLPVLMLLGITPTESLGTNRLQATIGELSAILFFLKKKVLKLKYLISGVIFTTIGATIGTLTAYLISDNKLDIILPILLFIIAIYSLFSHNILIDSKSRKILNDRYFFILTGLVIGFYNGFFGPGTGSIWMLAFVILLGSSITEASINAKPLNFIGNLISLIVFLLLGKVNIILGVVMGAGQIFGAFIGSHLVVNKGAAIIKPVFIFVVVCIALKEIFNYFF